MLEVRKLTKRYGKFTALEDVSFTVAPGEIFALLGPNGSGKTTALKCVAGLVRATEGTVLIGGEDIRDEGSRAKTLFTFLPQKFEFDGRLTGRELVKFFVRIRKLDYSRAEEVLQSAGFGLDGFMDRTAGEYSVGMVQRLGIALSLMAEAPLLIFDEPAISLDPEGVILFRKTLQSLNRAGKTIVFSSHRLSDVELLAHRVAVLVEGRLVAVQPVATLQSEATEEVRLRVVLANPEREIIDAVREAGATESNLSENVLTVSCRPADRLALLHKIERSGGVIESFSTDDAALEEMYLKLCQKKS